MLDFVILEPQGILVIQPNEPLRKEDFTVLGAAVDSYRSNQANLYGVLIHSKGFPGWENFGWFTVHMHFVEEHHKRVKRIAIVTDSHFAGTAESIGKRFISAEIMHFPYTDHMKALEWLEEAFISRGGRRPHTDRYVYEYA